MKIANIIFLAFALLANACYAEPSIYTIEGKFEAVFPSQPKLEGEFNIENRQIKKYYSIDEPNKIIYFAGITSSIDISPKEEIINIFIKAFIASKAKAMNGSVSFQDIIKQGSDYQAKFTIDLKQDGIPMQSQSAIIYHNSYIYEWSVASDVNFSGISNSSSVFNNYIKYFRVK
jgi:hypothetical protein